MIENDGRTIYETKLNRRAATLSILYLLAGLAFFSWQLFDIWIGQHSLARWVRYDLAPLDTPAFRMMIYTVIGGGLGGIVNGIRSVLQWFPVFDRKHIWKYITAPWLGTVLAFIVYALLNSGVAVLGGGSITDIDTTRILAMFSVGALAGYGAHDVFIWMDAQVTKVFKPKESQEDDKAAKVEAAPTPEIVDEAANTALDAVVSANGVDENMNATIDAVIKADSVDEEVIAMITAPHLVSAKGGPLDLN